MKASDLEETVTPELKVLMANLRQPGKVKWIGLRPERRATLVPVASVEALTGKGLKGDRASEKKSTKRQVTLIMAEHLHAAASILGQDFIDPLLTRRNIVTEGINLLALKDKQFKIGEVVLELSGPCHPCSRMEENLGKGGYNAMRGHGGWCATVVSGGIIRIDDVISII